MSRRAGLLRTGGLDLVGPLVVYRLCRDAGVPEVWSLVISGTPPALGVALDWRRRRTLDVVGAVVLGGITLSILLALASADPTMILVEGAAMTAAFGLACLVSLTRRRPLIFYFAQAFYGGPHSIDGARLDTSYEQYREARFYWRTVSAVWGVAYVVEAAVLYVVVRDVPTGAALTFNRAAPWLVSGLLFAWMFWWGARMSDQDVDDPSQQGGEPALSERTQGGTELL